MEDYDFAAAGGVPEDGGAASEEPRKKQKKKLTRREKGKIALTVRLNIAKGYASADTLTEFSASLNAFAGIAEE